MSRFLVFCLYGPLCSWGEVAVGEERSSQAHPTRSAVLGLLAGALGLRRHQEDELHALDVSLGLALRVISPGRPLTDFHTVEVPRAKEGVRHATRRDELLALDDKDNPILSFRQYRQDALYLACLWERLPQPPWPLETLAQALERPVFAPCLGRKSCPPALPFAPALVEAPDMVQALAAIRDGQYERLLTGLLGQGQASELYWDHDLEDTSHGWQGSPSQVFTRRDRLASRRRWQFAPRQEAQAPWPGSRGKED